jgi:hypothetical protein
LLNDEELVICKYNRGKSTNVWSTVLEFELEKNLNEYILFIATSINIICDDQSLDGRIDYIGNLILFIAKTKIHHRECLGLYVWLVNVINKNKNFVSVAI